MESFFVRGRRNPPEFVRPQFRNRVRRQFGHVYVWPIADYDSDLELPISTTKSLSNNEEVLEQSGMKKDIESELAELVSRRAPE